MIWPGGWPGVWPDYPCQQLRQPDTNEIGARVTR